MKITIRVRKSKTIAQLDAMIHAIREDTPLAMESVTDRTKADMIRLLSAKGHPWGTPTPSMPGEPPAYTIGRPPNRPGPLRRSISISWTMRERDHWEARVGPTVVYSRILELGGVTSGRYRGYIEPRPYVKTTVDELAASGFYRHEFRDTWADSLRSVTSPVRT